MLGVFKDAAGNMLEGVKTLAAFGEAMLETNYQNQRAKNADRRLPSYGDQIPAISGKPRKEWNGHNVLMRGSQQSLDDAKDLGRSFAGADLQNVNKMPLGVIKPDDLQDDLQKGIDDLDHKAEDALVRQNTKNDLLKTVDTSFEDAELAKQEGILPKLLEQ